MRARIVVRGRVQGVAYRASTLRKARDLGLTGWVRNLPDGSVELEAQGDPAAIDALLAWCHQGPPMARVTAVEVDELAPGEPAAGFEVRH